MDGLPGHNGTDGIPGQDGLPGADGKRGKRGKDFARTAVFLPSPSIISSQPEAALLILVQSYWDNVPVKGLSAT